MERHIGEEQDDSNHLWGNMTRYIVSLYGQPISLILFDVIPNSPDPKEPHSTDNHQGPTRIRRPP
jgi:hypothetical protein